MVEPLNGSIKEIGEFRRFGLRGYQKGRKEWALVCTGHNLKKLIRAMQGGQCSGGVHPTGGSSHRRSNLSLLLRPPVGYHPQSLGAFVLLLILHQCATDC